MASFALPLAGDAISAGLSLFGGGGAAGTDRKQQLAAYGDLNATQAQQSEAGGADTGAASRYYQALLSGNPTAIAAATQPIANATAQQTQQQRQAIVANGGARTGGTNATTQNLNGNADATTADAVSRAQNGAAAPLASLGSEETGKGLQAASTLGSEATANRGQSDKIASQKGAALGAFTSSPEAAKFAKSVSGFLLGNGGNSGTFGSGAPTQVDPSDPSYNG